MSRTNVLKTYKIFIGGDFLRTESGRTTSLKDKKGNLIANISLSSRKDFRNAVIAARNSQHSWSNRAAMNRGQILYRIAEMLEGRKRQFIEELILGGQSEYSSIKEVELSIDRLIYYAGWSDKYQQIFSTINPVSSSHFNFSVLEEIGVVSIVAPYENPLLGLISLLAPTIVGGNSAVILLSEKNPMAGISFAEILRTSDVPNGVVNVLSGQRKELIGHFASHKDVNAIIFSSDDINEKNKVESLAIDNLKRVKIFTKRDWKKIKNQSPYFIRMLQEVKTTWHPKRI